MKPIQYILGFGFVALGYLFQSRRKSFGKALSRLGLSTFVISAIVAVLFPDLFGLLAGLMGVGRGADLLIYMTTFCLISFVFLILAKIKQLESEITLLTREIALIAYKKTND